MKTFTIGKAALLAEVGIETIRFYEREGLIGPAARRESGYREYSMEAVRRIQFIKKAKKLGFSLKEIKELLSLKIDPNTTCQEIKGRAEAKIADIEEKLRTLEKMKRALVGLTIACSGRGPVSECPILEALER